MIADESNDIAEAMSAFFDGAADVLEETDFIDICPIGNVAGEIASTHEPLRVATTEVLTSWEIAVGDRLRNPGVADQEATALANTIIAAIEGGFLLARAHRSSEGLRTTGARVRQLVAAAIETA